MHTFLSFRIGTLCYFHMVNSVTCMNIGTSLTKVEKNDLFFLVVSCSRLDSNPGPQHGWQISNQCAIVPRYCITVWRKKDLWFKLEKRKRKIIFLFIYHILSYSSYENKMIINHFHCALVFLMLYDEFGNSHTWMVWFLDEGN